MKPKRPTEAMIAYRAAQLRLAKAAELRYLCGEDVRARWAALTSKEREALILREKAE